MTKRTTWQKAWALLDKRERSNALKVLGVMIVGALASAAMVGSVFPFLSVLADPGLITRNSVLSWIYQTGGFTSEYQFLLALGLAAISIIVISNAVLILQTWAVSRFTQMRIHAISSRLLSHYLAQPYEYFLGRHSGDMSTNILSEAQQAVGQFLRPMADIISASLTAAAIVATLVIADPVVATVSIGLFASAYITIATLTRRHVRAMGKARAASNAARYRIAGEALGGVKEIKLLGREADYLDRFNVPSFEMANAQVSVEVLGQAPRFAIQIIAFAGIVILCLVLLDPEGLQQREALGDILPLIGLLAFAGQRLMPEVQKLYQSVIQMTAGAAALERVYEDLCAAAQKGLKRNQAAPLGLRKALKLECVTYSYPKSDAAGIQELSLEIRAGERIGIVGSSGAGKTTFADLILGLLTPQEGVMVADDVIITPETLRSWQNTVGYVPQEIFLTDASLSENIALGIRPQDIDMGKVERASRIAQLHEFAMSQLSEGYCTRIGEQGVRLSGGQRQRIGIARALYHDADLIVFDEATSALDNITERELISAIDALPGTKTVVTIAHRLTTVKKCDRIFLFREGKVLAVGTWSELMRESAEFRSMTAGTNEAAA